MSNWKMANYKGWTDEERRSSMRETNKAIKKGVIPPPNKCNRCKQTKGIIHYHNHDYSDPIKYLEMLCWRCHMIHHSRWRSPQKCIDYWEQILQGKQFPPVFKHDFKILETDHGINETKPKTKQNNLETYNLQGV
jgi:hypothetical protein